MRAPGDIRKRTGLFNKRSKLSVARPSIYYSPGISIANSIFKWAAGLLPFMPIFILALLFFYSRPLPVSGFAERDQHGQSLHGTIVKDALSATLNQSNLALVIKSLDEEAKDAAMAADKLFAGNSLKSGVFFVDREQKKILDYASDADTSPGSRYRCLKHLGQLLLVAQDFYSRTNYLEIQAAKLTAKSGPESFDPYNIELVDWNKLNTALRANQPLAYGSASQAKETAEEGKSALGDTTYYKAARELAVRETLRQWQILETLIKQRYREKAVTILAALKEASCPASEPEPE